MNIDLPHRTPIRWKALLSFLDRRAVDGVETISADRYERLVDGERVVVDSGLQMTVPRALARRRDDLIARATRTFDLGANPAAIAKHLRRDPVLRPLVRTGTRVPGAWEPFEVAVRAIVGQQISVRGASTIMNRIAPLLTAEKLADITLNGMPRARADCIRGLARSVADDPAILTRGRSLDETIERLTSLRGIGRWTAHYIAMRALSEPDAFPDADLGLRKAAAAIGIDPNRLLDHAEQWRPWRAYAAIALWESL